MSYDLKVWYKFVDRLEDCLKLDGLYSNYCLLADNDIDLVLNGFVSDICNGVIYMNQAIDKCLFLVGVLINCSSAESIEA